MNQSNRITDSLMGLKTWTYQDILAATTPEELTEASLGRIFQHVQGDDSFAVISAFRDANSPAENNKQHKALKAAIKARNLGFFEMRGVGQEEDGGESVEKTVMIPKMSKQLAMKLGKDFDQFAVLYKGPETGNKVVMIEMDGRKETKLGEFKPQKMGQFYSKVKGRPFVFESMPQDWFEAQARAKVKLPGIDRA
jgi:hypothetical protein